MSDGAPRGRELLADLLVDPDETVRNAAEDARDARRLAHDQRHVVRVLSWAAQVDDDETYARVARHAEIARSILDDGLARRRRRFAMTGSLSPRARAFLYAAAPLRAATRVGVCVRGEARFHTSDGHRLDAAISLERTDEVTSAVTVLPDAGFSHFVATAPSSFMRMTIDGMPDAAVRIVSEYAGTRIEAADPRLLGLMV